MQHETHTWPESYLGKINCLGHSTFFIMIIAQPRCGWGLWLYNDMDSLRSLVPYQFQLLYIDSNSGTQDRCAVCDLTLLRLHCCLISVLYKLKLIERNFWALIPRIFWISLNTGFWLAEADHVTHILASDWLIHESFYSLARLNSQSLNISLVHSFWHYTSWEGLLSSVEGAQCHKTLTS